MVPGGLLRSRISQSIISSIAKVKTKEDVPLRMRRIGELPHLLLVVLLVPFELPGKVGVPRSFFVSSLDLGC
jgi:hypothetical protein